MFTINKVVIKNKSHVENFIQGKDVYNSLFLMKLRDPMVPKVAYEITTKQFRPDLIAKDFYGSTEYMGVLMLQLSSYSGLEFYKKGKIIPLIEKSHIDNLLSLF